MKTIYNILALLCAMLLVAEADAQSVSHKIAELGHRTAEGAHVAVAEQQEVTDLVKYTESQTRFSKLNGYRIVIYFDNEQYAQNRAASALSSFRNKYPHINAYLVYESPYFKVSVGDCINMEEAVILLNEIIGDYPTAFPKRETISIADLQHIRRRHTATTTTTEVATTEIATTEQSVMDAYEVGEE